jgi:GntR family transcriptional regulator
MFVTPGARNLLLHTERQKFLSEEWPHLQTTIQRLGLTATELFNTASHSNEKER